MKLYRVWVEAGRDEMFIVPEGDICAGYYGNKGFLYVIANDAAEAIAKAEAAIAEGVRPYPTSWGPAHNHDDAKCVRAIREEVPCVGL